MNTITIKCNEITPNVLQNIFDNLKRRIALCIQQNGDHFEHLL